MTPTIAIILAGGNGNRSEVKKQFTLLNEDPLFIHSIKNCKQFPIVLVIPEENEKLVRFTLELYSFDVSIDIVFGGRLRKQSVFNALQHIKHCYLDFDGSVLITEAARPLIKAKTFNLFSDKSQEVDCIVGAAKNVNTVCISIDSKNIDSIENREFMYELLMPQCFKFRKLYKAHCKTELIDATDDVSVLKSISEYANIVPKMFLMSRWEAFKMTYPEDILILESIVGVK